MFRTVLVLMIAVLLAACSRASPGTPDDSPAIEFTRSGGITGRTLAYRIYRDGRVEADGAEAADLDPAAVEAALVALGEAGFFEMEIPASQGTCNDCYEYTITVSDGSRTNTVSAVDNGELPEDFISVVDTITSLVEGGR